MVFELVDRILDVQFGERIVAAKQVVADDFLVEDGLNGGPHIAYPVVVESLAQAGGILVTASSGYRDRSVLGGIQTFRPGRPAHVGDWITLEAELDSRSDDAVLFRLRATCGGEEVASADGVLGVLVEAAGLEDSATTRARFDRLCNWQTTTARPVYSPMEVRWTTYDTLEEMVPGARARAHKAIPASHPLFDVHFPLFPVLPGVLPMHSLICLSQEVLAAGRSDQAWCLEAVHVARFQRYIRPGDLMVLEARLLRSSAEEVDFAASVSVDGRPALVLRRVSFAPRA